MTLQALFQQTQTPQGAAALRVINPFSMERTQVAISEH